MCDHDCTRVVVAPVTLNPHDPCPVGYSRMETLFDGQRRSVTLSQYSSTYETRASHVNCSRWLPADGVDEGAAVGAPARAVLGVAVALPGCG